MIKKSLFIFFGVIVLYSCNSKISLPKMADILFDVSLAMNYTQEQITVQKITDTNIIQNMKERALDTVCAIHKISTEELKSNFKYYENRPLDMQIILDSINQKSNRLLNLTTHQPDSLK